MAAIEKRRFVTRLDVEDAAKAGGSISLGPRDVITDEAAQRARDLGVVVSRVETSTPSFSAPPTPTAAPSHPAIATHASPDPALRALVRKAVIAELGHEPAGLDAALDKVFAN